MKIAIAGGTGFVGNALVKELQQNHEIIILTRKNIPSNDNENIRYCQWLTKDSSPLQALQGTDIFINLAGESINSGRWTTERKNRIRNSRIEVVQALLDLMNQLDKKPKALFNASAIGVYGTSFDHVFTEETKELGNDFLAETVRVWEEESLKAAELGIRTVLCRFGIILDKNEGALPRIVFPYKAFIGGNIGSGKQWMSWIHIDDVVKGISFLLNKPNIEGPVNFTAPCPVTMSKLGQTIAEVLHRPHWLSVPSLALRILLGEMSILVVEGQNVLPNQLLKSGYPFRYPELKQALQNIFS